MNEIHHLITMFLRQIYNSRSLHFIHIDEELLPLLLRQVDYPGLLFPSLLEERPVEGVLLLSVLLLQLQLQLRAQELF